MICLEVYLCFLLQQNKQNNIIHSYSLIFSQQRKSFQSLVIQSQEINLTPIQLDKHKHDKTNIKLNHVPKIIK